MLFFFTPNGLWNKLKAPTFCTKFPTFFLLFSYFYISEAPTFLLLFHMKSLESLDHENMYETGIVRASEC